MKLLITCMYSLLFSALRTYWLLSDTHYLNTIIDCLLTYLLTAVHCAWTSHTGPGNSITKTRSSWLIWWLSKLSLFIVPGDRQSKQTKSGKSESHCQPYHTSHHPAVDRPGSDSPTCLLNDNGFLDSATLAVLSGCSCTILTMKFFLATMTEWTACFKVSAIGNVTLRPGYWKDGSGLVLQCFHPRSSPSLTLSIIAILSAGRRLSAFFDPILRSTIDEGADRRSALSSSVSLVFTLSTVGKLVI